MPYLTEASDIRDVISQFTLCRILWVDTEVADWRTSQPRLSLIQVLDDLEDVSGNKTYVLDVLDRPELVEFFLNKVMINPNIEKVFHNANFDLRFLGGSRTSNVICTFNLARTLNKRLSVTNLQLKTLAVELCNFSDVNKEEGKSDWGQRPLTNKQLRYAQMDPVYLAQVHCRLLELTNQSYPKELKKLILREKTSDYSDQIRSEGDLTNQNGRQPKPLPSSANPPLFILVDGHSLAFRSYFAFAKGPDGGLKTKTGIPTSVCFGFLKSLLEVMETQQPQSMAVAFDLGLPTFCHEADDTYKADRPEMPEDFVPDLKNLQELLQAFNLPVLTSPGYKADDVLATLAKKGSEAGYRVKILTGDRDLFQLVDPQQEISVLYLSTDFLKRCRSTGPTEFGQEQVKEKLGISPAQVVDYKALCGDKSDNIPGVKGIGEKTAVQLLERYGTLEGIYASLDKIKGATKTKLKTGKQDAEHSRYLAQLAFDAPVNIEIEDAKLEGFDTEVLKPLLEKLEFQAFLGKLAQLQQNFGGTAIEKALAEVYPHQPKSSKVYPHQPKSSEDDPDLWFFCPENTESKQIWSGVLDHIQRRTVQTLLRQHGHLISFSANVARIGIKSEPLLSRAQQELSYVEAAFQKTCGRQVKVIFQVEAQPECPTVPTAQQPALNQADSSEPFPKAN